MKRNLRLVVILFLSFKTIDGSAQYIGQHTRLLTVPAAIPVKASSFDLDEVRLLAGRFKDNMTREGSWMLSLPVNRMLHSFRVNAGMLTDDNRSKTKMPIPLGGWEELDMELRGHSVGHLLSGLSLQYAATGDSAFIKKIDSLVTGLAEVQNTLNQGGYLSAFPQNYIDRDIAGKKVWAPWYTIHKIVAGLIDAYWYTGNTQALDIANKMASWAYAKTFSLNAAQLNTMLKNEFGGMNEAWYNLYAITGNSEQKKLGDLFYNKEVLDPLARQEDHLAGMHANTMIPKVIGEARAYELTGDEKYQTIAFYFWDNVIKNQTYVTGSNSNKEHFIKPGKISEYITGYTGETCNTYNMLKLTRHLFTWTADEKYAEYYERALYNHILGQQDPKTGMVCYFTPLAAGTFRVYSTRDSSFWCCVGTGFESQSKFAEAIYYHDEKGVFVNLFIPSVLNWEKKGFKIRQETAFPQEPKTKIIIENTPPGNMALYIRYPMWARSGVALSVNGKYVQADQQPGTYITINRKWHRGDVIEVTYPMSLRLEATPDNANVAAVLYGPIVLAGEMGTEGMKKPAPYHDPSDPYQYYNYDYHIPADISHSLALKGKSMSEKFTTVKGQPLTFETAGEDGNKIVIGPYYELHRQRYVVYWDLK
ncbi:beta-L-arabinofuranosidase domain-containing protein [Mucilaginibacter sp. X5P1]|uniref:glycoside hydrolase family 127 protein n=1 Tax=Mucilaginibacter sp. X5P1 TaxID=2723088 RepID=UPI00161183AD|nr:glycoside hydrolase family 127 protein [Mucilaginibacter sp. X5P1]MBB6138299.1 hypothetical protein [Mucilaginibacter sp. X5P1]